MKRIVIAIYCPACGITDFFGTGTGKEEDAWTEARKKGWTFTIPGHRNPRCRKCNGEERKQRLLSFRN